MTINKKIQNKIQCLPILNKQQTEFLSIVAHQFRTPLSVISGYVAMLTEGDYGKLNKKTAPILNNISYSIERLTRLVDQLLDLGQIESGKMIFNFCRHDVNCLISEVINELRPKLSHKVKMEFVGKKSGPFWADIDADKISNVIFNLIDNAIKYTDKGKISVRLQANKKQLIIKIKDTGIGLSQSDKAKVFSKFFRSRYLSSAIDKKGTGLGLFIVSKFVKAHRGEVWCKSDGRGKGSEFGFSLPLKQAAKCMEIWA